MSVWALVDGGGTKTRVRLIDSTTGQAYGEATAGPGSLTRGADLVWQSIEAALENFSIRPDRLYCGLAGVESADQRDQFLASSPCPVTVLSDRDSGLLGAHQGAPGACLTVGTGIALAWMDAKGRVGKRGGLGFVLGDEGSGAWLGRRAMQHVVRALDRGDLDAVSDQVFEALGWPPELSVWVARGQRCAPNDFAALVPAILALDDAGDPLAQAVMAEAVDAVCELLGSGAPELPLALVGGLTEIYANRLKDRGWTLVSAKGDALDGLWWDVQNPVVQIERWTHDH